MIPDDTLMVCGADGLDRARRAQNLGDYAAALAELEPLAVRGNATAERYLAYMYFEGQGVENDPAKAVDLLRRSADKGDLLSVYSLAGAYLQGLGVEKDEVEAIALYKGAANGGNANAQLNLGSMYRFGKGVPQDLGEAVKWFRAAARQGHPRAEKILGYCYAEGIGLEHDDAESVRWLKQAAEKDDSEAQYLVGLKYVHGVGVTQDLAEASRWFRRPQSGVRAGRNTTSACRMPRDKAFLEIRRARSTTPSGCVNGGSDGGWLAPKVWLAAQLTAPVPLARAPRTRQLEDIPAHRGRVLVNVRGASRCQRSASLRQHDRISVPRNQPGSAEPFLRAWRSGRRMSNRAPPSPPPG